MKKEELKSVGFYRSSDGNYYEGNFDYMYDPVDQMLYSHCEVYGDLDPLIKVQNIEHLKEILGLWKQ